MRATDGGKHRCRDADQRPFWGTGAPITCVHNVEILTRFTWMLAVHASRIPHGSLRGAAVAKKRERAQKEGRRRRRKRYEKRPHFTSPCIRGPRFRRALVASCHLSWNSRGQVAFEWVFFRVRVDALEFYRHFPLTVNKATREGLALHRGALGITSPIPVRRVIRSSLNVLAVEIFRELKHLSCMIASRKIYSKRKPIKLTTVLHRCLRLKAKYLMLRRR